jgi:hypothetical protein
MRGTLKVKGLHRLLPLACRNGPEHDIIDGRSSAVIKIIETRFRSESAHFLASIRRACICPQNIVAQLLLPPLDIEKIMLNGLRDYTSLPTDPDGHFEKRATRSARTPYLLLSVSLLCNILFAGQWILLGLPKSRVFPEAGYCESMAIISNVFASETISSTSAAYD